MPIVLGVAGVAGAVMMARFLRREWRRVNRELDSAGARTGARTDDVRLRRDPASGEWRPD
jgi:hypothetical protein